MAFMKSTFWSVGVAFIPVVCGNPCEFQRRGGATGFVPFETGMGPETGIVVEPVPPNIESIQITCTVDEPLWSYSVEVSGQVGVARVLPRYAMAGTATMFEEHELVWDFHPTNGDWSLFTLSLPQAMESDWEPGVSTLIPCEDPFYENHAWMIEIWDTDGDSAVCVLYGAQAALFQMDFPSCSIWE